MGKFQSTKTFGPYSAGIRQWKAQHSHCQLIHGYGFKFQITFAPINTEVNGGLDEMNWVQDFGGFKRNGLNEWLDDMFDHTLLIEKDDPHKESFEALHDMKVAKVIFLDAMGCENLAKLCFDRFNDRLSKIEGGRVKVVKVECFEHEKNSGIYLE